MRPQYRTITSVVNDVDNIAVSQTVTGDFTLNGALVVDGVAILANAQYVSLTSAGNQSAKTVTIVGINENGARITESLAGPNANTVTTTNYFKKVISVSCPVAITCSVGVSNAGGAVSSTITCNWRERQFKVGMGLVVTGTSSSDVQHTFDDINDTEATLTWYNTYGLTTITANAESNIAFPCTGVRLRANTMSSGEVTLTYIQA
jgi:hypothetical protein